MLELLGEADYRSNGLVAGEAGAAFLAWRCNGSEQPHIFVVYEEKRRTQNV